MEDYKNLFTLAADGVAFEQDMQKKYMQEWIDTYCSKEFEQQVSIIKKLSKKALKNISSVQIEKLKIIFRTSCLYEYELWNSF